MSEQLPTSYRHLASWPNLMKTWEGCYVITAIIFVRASILFLYQIHVKLRFQTLLRCYDRIRKACLSLFRINKHIMVRASILFPHQAHVWLRFQSLLRLA